MLFVEEVIKRVPMYQYKSYNKINIKKFGSILKYRLSTNKPIIILVNGSKFVLLKHGAKANIYICICIKMTSHLYKGTYTAGKLY